MRRPNRARSPRGSAPSVVGRELAEGALRIGSVIGAPGAGWQTQRLALSKVGSDRCPAYGTVLTGRFESPANGVPSPWTPSILCTSGVN